MATEKTTKTDEKAVEAKPAAAAKTEPKADAPVEAAAPAPATPQTPPPPPVADDTPPEAPVQAPAAPKGDRIKVRVLRNLFHDGRRFRATGELIALNARQLKTAGDAVERV